MMKRILMLVVTFLLMFTSFAHAYSISDVKFTGEAKSGSILGVSVTPVLPLGGYSYDTPLLNDYYIDGKVVISVRGIGVSITNNTDAVAVINWKDSSIDVDGQPYGVPFLDGMKYMNAGNPNATPNSVIPPHQTIEKLVFLPNVKMMSRHWNVEGAPLLRVKNRVINLYVSVTVRGTTDYAIVSTPGINMLLKGISAYGY